MKRILALLAIIVFMSSCEKEYQPRIIDSISIKEFKIDSISIRTIVALDQDRVLFAGSNGNYGAVINEIITKDKLRYQDSIYPSFRSLASNGTDHFMLSISNPGLLYKMSDNPEIVYKETHEKVFYDSMKFFDEQNGIAMGDPTEDCLSVILTNDGGNTWTKVSCDNMPKTIEGEAAFAASNTNIKVLGKTAWIVTGGAKARVFKSIDLGQTWEAFETPFIQGDGPQGIYSVDFSDENNGIIFGGDYSKPKENKQNKAITKDGGKTWQLVADGQAPNYKSCVQYVPGTDGKEVFAVGFTGVSYSNDGGITWSEVSKDGYYTIEFVDRNTAWLSGSQKIGKLILK